MAVNMRRVHNKRSLIFSSSSSSWCVTLLCVAFFALALFRPSLSAADDEPSGPSGDIGEKKKGEEELSNDKDNVAKVDLDDNNNDNSDDVKTDEKKQPNESEESTDNGDGDEESVSADDKPNGTFDRLYTEGIKAYTDQLWYSCASKIESALKDYKLYTSSLTQCRLECNEGVRQTKLSNLSSGVEAFAKFFTFLKISDCFRRCKEDLVGNRNPVSAEIQHAFEERGPYIYLQFCYFKLDKLKLAASSSYTYFLRHPDDDDTKSNIRYYRDSLNVPTSDFQDLEMTPFKEHYIRGALAYHEQDWPTAMKHMELAVTEFLDSLPKCQADCYDSVKLAGRDFITGVADAVARVMMCQIECETKLSVVYSDPIPNILQDMFHHLQYIYYTVEDYEKSAEAMASFLLMNASHEVMQSNKEAMKSLHKFTETQFVPSKVIEQYIKQRKDMMNTMDFITKNYKWPEDVQVDDAVEYDEMMAELNKAPEDWMTRYERLGMHVVAKATDLHRGGRFVSDGILKSEQCDELNGLLENVPYNSKGVKVFNFRTAQKMLSDDPGEENEGALRLLIRAAEVVRLYMQRYSQEETTYFFQHFSIICHRPAEETRNCYPQEDGTCLQFNEMPDELSYGMFTTVTFLSDVDEDGDFYFLNENKEKDGSFGVKCGRTAGFITGDRHSFNIPATKERCGIVIRYSQERAHDDREFSKTIVLLQKIEELRRLKGNALSAEEVLKSFKEKGVKILKSGLELKGTERLLADGLASEQQCNTLKNMVLAHGLDGDGYQGDKSPLTFDETFAGLSLSKLTESAALAGDGYDHLATKPSLISPHTENEIFLGLNVYRASKLFHGKMISNMAFNTFLDLSENARLLVEKFFNISSPLYFDYTHLVCRKARDDSKLDREDLSHPVHADNCVLQPDGSCSKEFPAFTQRSYSAILYLNDGFQGGEFFFAHSNKSEQISVRPKCGRLVGFNAGEFHGVRAVISGERCALALWFTHDPNFKEMAHIHARKVIKGMEELERKKKAQAREDL